MTIEYTWKAFGFGVLWTRFGGVFQIAILLPFCGLRITLGSSQENPVEAQRDEAIRAYAQERYEREVDKRSFERTRDEITNMVQFTVDAIKKERDEFYQAVVEASDLNEHMAGEKNALSARVQALETALHDALGRHQVTHIHEALRTALKAGGK